MMLIMIVNRLKPQTEEVIAERIFNFRVLCVILVKDSIVRDISKVRVREWIKLDRVEDWVVNLSRNGELKLSLKST